MSVGGVGPGSASTSYFIAETTASFRPNKFLSALLFNITKVAILPDGIRQLVYFASKIEN